MISVETIIARFRRDLTLSTLLKWALLIAAAACILFGNELGSGLNATVLLIIIGAIWLALSYQSVKGSRLAAGSSGLIAAGQYERAEKQIDQALRGFSLFRAVKLLSLHHLAVLRHAQRQWRDSAILCQALLHQRLGPLRNLSKSSRLILADALLELDDLNGVHAALTGLHAQHLSLGESMNLLIVQLEYQTRIGDWAGMMGGIGPKIQMAELMTSADAARVQAALALAARHIGRDDWSQWLRSRVQLLCDPQQLAAARPLLRELWQ